MRYVLLCVTAICIPACGTSGTGSIGSEIGRLKAQQQVEHQRLQAILRRIAESEREAEQAAIKANFERCRAEVNEVAATVAKQIADCRVKDANYSECRAHKSRNKASGCAVGLFLGFGLLGCAGAALASSSGDDCGIQPECETTPGIVLQTELQHRKLTKLPMCGGQAGIVVEKMYRVMPVDDGFATSFIYPTTTLSVDSVIPDSPALKAGIVKGDIIESIGNVPVYDVQEAFDALRLKPAGETVRVRIVRNDKRTNVDLVLAPRRDAASL